MTIPDEAATRAQLVATLATADTPFRLWAAVVLTTQGRGADHDTGQSWIAEAKERVPDEPEHADIVAYGLLAEHGLERGSIDRLVAAAPIPHADAGQRARLYQSPTYVYLLCRGLGRHLPWPDRLLNQLNQEVAGISTTGDPDVVDLILLTAARFELASSAGQALGQGDSGSSLLRIVGGRIAGGVRSTDACVAVRWLLERYGDTWPAGQEGAALRVVARGYVEACGQLPAAVPSRPAVSAMMLEMMLAATPRYQLFAVGEAERAARGRRRAVETAAYTALITLAAGGPMAWLVTRCHLAIVAAVIAAVYAVAPSSLWAGLTVYGRPRSLEGLGAAFAFGLLYYGSLVAAAVLPLPGLMAVLLGDGTVLAVGVAVIAGLFVALQTARKSGEG